MEQGMPLGEAGNELKRRTAMKNENINEIESAERQNITNETAGESGILTDDELKGVSAGVRTNGDNPFVQVVALAEQRAFYKGMWYDTQGWPN
jgi:hypothetical protein